MRERDRPRDSTEGKNRSIPSSAHGLDSSCTAVDAHGDPIGRHPGQEKKNTGVHDDDDDADADDDDDSCSSFDDKGRKKKKMMTVKMAKTATMRRMKIALLW